MVKVCTSSTDCLVIVDGLTRGQAERIAGIVTAALEEEREENRITVSGVGSKNMIPCGRFHGLTVDDVYQQFSFEGLSVLLHCIPALLNENPELIDPVFFARPYPFIVSLNNEIILYTCVTLLNSRNSSDPITLKEFIRWFGDFLPKDLSASGYNSLADIQPDSLSEKDQDILFGSLHQILQEKWLTDQQNITFPEEKIFDCDLKIPDGMYGGLRIRDVFLSDRYHGIVKLLCTAKQMNGGEALYRSVLLYTLTVLKHREYLPFADFLDAFGMFFPAEDSSALLSLPAEKQRTEYERLSICLGRRMLKSLEETEAGQAA